MRETIQIKHVWFGLHVQFWFLVNSLCLESDVSEHLKCRMWTC